MKTRSTVKRTALFVGAVAAIVAALLLNTNSDRGSKASAAPQGDGARRAQLVTFNQTGELVRPTDFRKWIYVGTPLTPHDMNNGKAAFPEFHSVYINPQAYDHYENTGVPDGTVLIKELVSVGTKQATSGSGYFMGEFTGLELLMKDKRRFQDEPGNWGFFSFGHEYPLKSTQRFSRLPTATTATEGRQTTTTCSRSITPCFVLRRKPRDSSPHTHDHASHSAWLRGVLEFGGVS